MTSADKLLVHLEEHGAFAFRLLNIKTGMTRGVFDSGMLQLVKLHKISKVSMPVPSGGTASVYFIVYPGEETITKYIELVSSTYDNKKHGVAMDVLPFASKDIFRGVRV